MRNTDLHDIIDKSRHAREREYSGFESVVLKSEGRDYSKPVFDEKKRITDCPLFFHRKQITNQVSLDKCIFSCGITIHDTEFNSYLSFKESLFLSSIVMQGKYIHLTLNFEDTIVDSDIEFNSVRFEGKVNFKDAKLAKGLKFDGCTFDKNADFSKIMSCGSLSFNNCTFNQDISFEDAQLNDISFDNKCTFKGDVNFSKSSIKCNLEIKNCYFEKKINFLMADFSIIDDITLENSQFNELDCSANGEKPDIVSISIKHCLFQGEAKFYDRHFTDIMLYDVVFNGISDFYRSTFNKGAQFIKVRFNDTAIFTKVKFKKHIFALINCSISKGLIFHDTEFKKGVNLAAMHFTGDGMISSQDCIYGNFPLTNENIDVYLDSNWQKITKSHLRETFRILKNEALKQNNRIAAIDYHAKEMEAHTLCVKSEGKYILSQTSKETKLDKLAHKLSEKAFKKDTIIKSIVCAPIAIPIILIMVICYPFANIKFNSDLFVLKINQITNNHGSDWKRGIIFTLSTSAIFFMLFWFSLEQAPVVFNANASLEQTLNGIGNIFSNYLNFTNPTHRVSFMENHYSEEIFTKGAWTVFFDFIARILIGLGFYQTIQAFRKYGRF